MLPRQTLFTDERMGDALLPAIERLPRGSGVVLRHDRLSREARRALAERIAALARDKGLILSVAGDMALARHVGAAMVHRPESDPGGLPFSLPVHDEEEARAAADRGAALVYVSPVHPTRSHPGAPALGEAEAIRLARLSGCPAIALGGMTADRYAAIEKDFAGWAAISAFM
ncbi:thiamine phosphate synthase [Sphingomicrobium lutaoense]|uniref:Thiamine-phosphate pyrophosphorylase n=1 Tax=Sphingomicrobium lutaoense TaxID=515949 RepID=A0A839Z590_9SPHN|nr:thiamine phosphate synthase [Sphingomicrobium lutaoense]MBB3764782.1 thiamine-phosphate pyrophosphorylase [Sphingomicrobium lutaoense]